MNEIDKKRAKVLWEYHGLNEELKASDLILVLGSHDLRVAEYAAGLFVDGLASMVVISGGMAHVGDLLQTGWKRTEAEEFADILIQEGVPENNILLERESWNTGDNFRLSGELLKEKGVDFQSVIVVTKPYMERRAYATGKKHWPNIKMTIASPELSFEEYLDGSIDADATINIMVGDLQRILEYPKLGYQIEQEVPEQVMHAYKALVKAGYDKHLLD